MLLSASAQNIIFKEGFDNVPEGSIPSGWILGDGGLIDQHPPLDPDSTWTVVSLYRTGGNYFRQGQFLYIKSRNLASQKDTITTPSIQAGAANKNIYLGYLTYYRHFNNDTGFVQVWDSVTSSWVTIKIYTGRNFGGWVSADNWEIFDLTPYKSNNLKIRFIWHERDGMFWAIDSVTIYAGCHFLGPLNITWLDSSSAVLTYSGNYDSIKVEYGIEGFIPGSGTIITLEGISPDTISGLHRRNSYDMYIWGYCGNLPSTDTQYAYLCGGTIIPFLETFDDSILRNGCWSSSNLYIGNVDYGGSCELEGGYLKLWGDTALFVESPFIYVSPGSVNTISYYVKGGSDYCGEIPDPFDYVVVSWYDTIWHQLASHYGGIPATNWTRKKFSICPSTSQIKIRFKIGRGDNRWSDSWYFDSLMIVRAPNKPDIKVESVSNIGLPCGSLGTDTLVITYKNLGNSPADTIFINVLYQGASIDTFAYYTGGFGGCSQVDDIDTIKIPVNITQHGIYLFKVWARSGDDAELNDTFKTYLMYGSIPTYINIHTGSWGAEVYWKLFHIPDSILIASVTPDSYLNYRTYTHSFCAVENNTYRFEAWDDMSDGWNGGTYTIFTIDACGDTIILANNHGNPVADSFGSKIEEIEYFTVKSPNVGYKIKLTSILEPDTSKSCGAPLDDSIIIVLQNAGFNTIDTLIYGYKLLNRVKHDTVIYQGGLSQCEYDTLFIDTFTLTSSITNIVIWANSNQNDSLFGDTITKELTAADLWTKIQINTGYYGYQVYWKLFKMPDSILIMSVPAISYSDNRTYVDSFCAVSNSIYRFEAWDDYGNGWEGGTYSIFTVNPCGDTIIFANNNGEPVPDSPGKLELVEYFSIYDPSVTNNVSLVSVLEPDTSLACEIPLKDSIIIVFKNTGINSVDTVYYGYSLRNISKVDTIVYSSGLNPCMYDTVYIDTFRLRGAVYEYLHTWARAQGDMVPYDDTIHTGLTAADKWIYVQIKTPYYNSFHIFWKLFYVPDSFLVAYELPYTYFANRIYVDSFCAINKGTYRFEAWDVAGEGWHGGSYKIFTIDPCGDTIIFANNGGEPVPDSPNRLTLVEYFITYNPFTTHNVRSISILEPDTPLACGSPLIDSVSLVFKNSGIDFIDTVYLGYILRNTIKMDTIVYNTGLPPCTYDTVYIDTFLLQNAVLEDLKVWVRGSNDTIPYDDSLVKKLIAGDRWTYIQIHTGYSANHLYWKLFYIPDSILISAIEPFTYYNNRTYTDSFCSLDSAIYRFEAWEFLNGGWYGAQYQIFTLTECGDTFIFANNGQPVSSNSPYRLETVEYFMTHDPNVSHNMKLVEILNPKKLVCNKTLADTAIIVLQNAGLDFIDTVYYGCKLLNHGYLIQDTTIYSSGLAPCQYDTVYLPIRYARGLLQDTIIAWASITGDTIPRNDSLYRGLQIGNRWAYIKVKTRAWAHEIYWKVFYLPDSILIASIPYHTYLDNKTYRDSFCVFDSAIYRFEAWSHLGRGWKGAKYEIYIPSECGDSFIIANNDGQPVFDSVNSDLELVEYFMPYDPSILQNVRLITILKPSERFRCGSPLRDSVTLVLKNTGFNIIDTVYYGYSFLTHHKHDTIIYLNGLQPCQYDTIFVDPLFVRQSVYKELNSWAFGNNDKYHYDDSLVKKLMVGNRWAYLKIRTAYRGYEIFWKLYYMPDNTWAAGVRHFTYVDNNTTYIDSFCVVDSGTYRFEAWDSGGDGWNGGRYEIFVIDGCNDTLILANNNGHPVTDSPNSYLESVEYFTVIVPKPYLHYLQILPYSIIELCAKDTPVILDATLSGYGNVYYYWNTGDTSSIIKIYSTGDYIVSIKNDTLCLAVDTASVIIKPSPQAGIIGPDSINPGETYIFYAIPSGDQFSYLWNTGDTIDSILYTIPTGKNDTLWLIVTNQYGCSDTAFKIIEIVSGMESAIAYHYKIIYDRLNLMLEVLSNEDIIEWVKLFNLSGDLVYGVFNANSNKVIVSLRNLPIGLYVVQVKGKKANIITYKILR